MPRRPPRRPRAPRPRPRRPPPPPAPPRWTPCRWGTTRRWGSTPTSPTTTRCCRTAVLSLKSWWRSPR
ncbi:hypothetical protein B5F36_04815 [Anaerofilum sp. An201]|nr:hypothetical protein B5F36_04815 [Anaerofilum sp. An201]